MRRSRTPSIAIAATTGVARWWRPLRWCAPCSTRATRSRRSRCCAPRGWECPTPPGGRSGTQRFPGRAARRARRPRRRARAAARDRRGGRARDRRRSTCRGSPRSRAGKRACCTRSTCSLALRRAWLAEPIDRLHREAARAAAARGDRGRAPSRRLPARQSRALLPRACRPRSRADDAATVLRTLRRDASSESEYVRGPPAGSGRGRRAGDDDPRRQGPRLRARLRAAAPQGFQDGGRPIGWCTRRPAAASSGASRRVRGRPSRRSATIAVRARREQVEAAERVRTLYVALTRAKRTTRRGGLLRCEATPRDTRAFRARRAPRCPARRGDAGRCGARDRHRDARGRRGGGRPRRVPGRSAGGGGAGPRSRTGELRIHRGPRAKAMRSACARRACTPRSASGARSAAALRRRFPTRFARRAIGGDAERATQKRGRSARERAAGDGSRGGRRHGDPRAAGALRLGRAMPARSGRASARGCRLRSPRRVAPSRLDAALDRAAALLARLGAGSLWSRLRALAPHVLARELPVLVRARGGRRRSRSAYVVGAIDLVYRDPDGGEVVGVDFKTDRIATAGAIAERARCTIARRPSCIGARCWKHFASRRRRASNSGSSTRHTSRNSEFEPAPGEARA